MAQMASRASLRSSSAERTDTHCRSVPCTHREGSPVLVSGHQATDFSLSWTRQPYKLRNKAFMPLDN
eukprot:scaffold236551_cov10-Prasinocladus_malaysianus.AAC.1